MGELRSPTSDCSGAESTVALLERARAGDRQALDDLLTRCVPPLQRWARGRLPQYARSSADTVDLVQDVVLQTLKRIDSFTAEREGALQAYLRTALLNRIRDELRRAGRRPSVADLSDCDPRCEGPSPLEQAIGREALERYEAALARLDPIEREAIIARVELGYNYAQMAEALGRPTPDAARVALRRALVRLAEQMRHV